MGHAIMSTITDLRRKPWSARLGLGTLASVLTLFVFVFQVLAFNNESLFNRIVPSGAFHNAVSAPLAFLLLLTAVFIGRRYPEHVGARVGRNAAIAILAVLTLFGILNLLGLNSFG